MFASETILKERYQLKEKLGRTATGHQTWLAKNLYTDERVILKLLAFSPQMQWEELKLFEREAKVLEALNHPRIPSYKDYFDLEKNPHSNLAWFVLVQKSIAGNSLQDLLEKKKTFSEKEARAIATEVLKILIYLHELSPPVLHRDIKPSNLILGEDKKIYLVDFGAVQAQAAVTGITFTVVGTSGYAPLE
jgi:serine/threonine protein kinase